MRNYVFFMVLLLLYYGSANGQEVKMYLSKYNTVDSTYNTKQVEIYNYTIHNNDTSQIIIFFTEDDITKIPREKLIRKKFLRKYGDFSLSMLEWEANMDICQNSLIIPELFVKVLNPGETFYLYIYNNYETKLNPNYFNNHILTFKVSVLKNKKVGFPNFVENLNTYKYEYPFSYIVIDSEKIRDFINKWEK